MNLLKELKEKNLLLYSALSLAVVCLAVGALFIYQYSLNKNKDVLVTVGSEKITKDDLNGKINEALKKDISSVDDKTKQSMLDSLIENSIINQKATALGITVDQKQIQDYANANFENYKNASNETKKVLEKTAKESILKNQVSAKVVSWREGQFILVRADLHITSSPTEKSAEERARLIPEDLQYGKALAQKLLSNITAKNMTFDVAMENEKADQKLGETAWLPWRVVHSQKFTKEDSIDKRYPLDLSSFWDEIFKQKIGETSKVISLNTAQPEGVDNAPKSQEGAYLIVKSDKGVDGENSFEDWLAKQKKELIKY